MAQNTLINEIGEWLIDEALDEPDIIDLFDRLCHRLYAAGIPIARARLTWPTLHPLFRAETVLWHLGQDVHFEQFRHQDDTSQAWLKSPMAFILENSIQEFRRHLVGPKKMLDFPVLEELAQEGMTDYLVVTTSFVGSRAVEAIGPTGSGPANKSHNGIIVTWASARESGFADDDIASLKIIQRRFGVACKTVVQRRIASNITETYVGRFAGAQVLEGAIRLGDGKQINAVVWYADMRNSTALGETMPADDFLELLNDYFLSTAAPAIQYGGEVLDFIGDAVLAIFPYDDDSGRGQAIALASMALEDTITEAKRINAERLAAGKQVFEYGVGLNAGPLMFGNIGVPSRLSFSVIGPTINEVERIETLTKTLGANVLACEAIAQYQPERWVSLGKQDLKGVNKPCEVFALRMEVEDKNLTSASAC